MHRTQVTFEIFATMTPDPDDELQGVSFREITPALEFMAWVMVLLAPLLRLANGPPVTDDQWYFQVFVGSASLIAAVGLRLYNWRVPLE